MLESFKCFLFSTALQQRGSQLPRACRQSRPVRLRFPGFQASDLPDGLLRVRILPLADLDIDQRFHSPGFQRMTSRLTRQIDRRPRGLLRLGKRRLRHEGFFQLILSVLVSSTEREEICRTCFNFGRGKRPKGAARIDRGADRKLGCRRAHLFDEGIELRLELVQIAERIARELTYAAAREKDKDAAREKGKEAARGEADKV